jgi:flagellar assembly protein FliH
MEGICVSKAVMSKEEAEKVAVSFTPRRFPTVVSATAHSFVAFNVGKNSSFRIDDLVAQQTGVAEIERLSLEEKVEREALVRLKELQEQAYEQAYQLGLDEGREKAFLEQQEVLAGSLHHLEQMLSNLENLKSELITSNEAQIVRLIFYISKRLVLRDIAANPDSILEVAKQAVESAQSEEHVTLRMSPTDFAFVEAAKERLGKEFDALKRARLEQSPEITPGGCIVETNYGDVDATIEQRLEKLWASISEKLPNEKSVVSSESTKKDS